MRSALASAEENLGPRTPLTALAAEWLGIILRDQGRIADAEPYFRRSLEIWQNLAPRDPITARNAMRLGNSWLIGCGTFVQNVLKEYHEA